MRMSDYPLVKHKMHNGRQSYWEYPLWDHYQLCPTARFVGGVSKWLCECQKPGECAGVLAVAKENAEWRQRQNDSQAD